MPERTTKSIRITEDAQRLLRLLAAFEDRTEGTIIEDALAAYLQIRSLGYGNVLPEARELAHTTPEDVGETLTRLTGAIENALAEGRLAPKPGDAKQRLRERAKQQRAA
jgi:predicted transcriptional regulator